MAVEIDVARRRFTRVTGATSTVSPRAFPDVTPTLAEIFA